MVALSRLHGYVTGSCGVQLMLLQRIYRQVAIGDLALFGVLAIPGLGSWVLGLLLQANAALGWSGSLQPSAGVHLLVNLLGVLGLGLAWMRLQAGVNPTSLRITVLVKFWAACMFGLGVMLGAPVIFLVIGVVDMLQGLLLLALPLMRGNGARSNGGMTT